MLLVLALGVLIRILFNFKWSDMGNMLQWERFGFGLVETVFAPIAATTALGFLMLGPRLSANADLPKWLGILKIGFLALSLIVLLEALILTQTRGAWLAAAIVYPISLFIRYNRFIIGFDSLSWKKLALFVLAILLLFFLFQENTETIVRRINSESLQSSPPVEMKEVDGQKVLMTTSLGYRKLLWSIGLKKWMERPLFGWGPGSTELLLKQEHHPLLSQPPVIYNNGKASVLSLSHLHNLYLELLVRFGIFGTLLFLSMPLVMLSGVRKSFANNRIPWDCVCFLFAGWGLIAIMYFFDFQIFKYAWRNNCLLWAAFTFAVQIGNLEAEAKSYPT